MPTLAATQVITNVTHISFNGFQILLWFVIQCSTDTPKWWPTEITYFHLGLVDNTVYSVTISKPFSSQILDKAAYPNCVLLHISVDSTL